MERDIYEFLTYKLQDMFATELLLRLLHDLQELLEGNTAITRDISLMDNLVNISLRKDEGLFLVYKE